MKKRIYTIASLLAVGLIALFMLATITAEISGSRSLIFGAKTVILFGLFILVASIILAGVLGRSMAAENMSPTFRRMRRRLTIVAPIGLLVLTPYDVTLRALAVAHNFGILFVVLQILEFIGGITNLTLLSLNVRDNRHVSHR